MKIWNNVNAAKNVSANKTFVKKPCNPIIYRLYNLQEGNVGFHCFIAFLNFLRLSSYFILSSMSSHIFSSRNLMISVQEIYEIESIVVNCKLFVPKYMQNFGCLGGE